MAEEQAIDPAVIKKTQTILGKYVKRPPLTDKLLKKPPFRFLQDVVNAVIKDTGYLDGLYSKTELSAEGITDRNGKIDFLQKLIDILKLVSNESIAARSSKIVAGHEPEKTNQLLQILGNCIEKKLDYKSAIESVSGVVVVQTKDDNKKKSEVKESKNKKTEPKSTTAAKENKTKSVKKDKEATPLKTSTVKNKDKAKPSNAIPKEKEKSKTTTKPALSEAKESDKKEHKTSPKTKKDLENKKEKAAESRIEKNKSDVTILEQNEAEPNIQVKEKKVTAESIASPEVSPEVDNVNVNREQISMDVNNSHDSSVESRRSSAKKQKLRRQKKSDDDVSHHSENTNQENVAIKKNISLEEDAEKSPNNNRTKENRRSSGKSRKSNVEKTEPSTHHEHKIQEATTNMVEKHKSVNNENIDTTNQQQKIDDAPSQTPPVKRQSTFTREESRDSNGRPRTSLRPPSVRPPSARPGAPRRRDKNIEIVLQPNEQIKMAGIQLSVEGLEDDGENLVIIENENTNNIMDEKKQPISEDVKLDDDVQQGHLVQQILETQKVLVQNHDTKDGKDGEVDMTTLQNRQSSAKQMNSLRDVIQNLTRSVNPLGKLMDFIPEDMDAMQLEINMWRDFYSQTSVELKKEKSLTESAIEPIKNQLEQINVTIKEYIEMIDESRSKIIQNADRIFNLLTEY